MNSDTSKRDAELRQALVSMATLSKYSRPRLSPRVIVASIAAFAVVGALTGGAVAVAATGSNEQSATAIATKVSGLQLVKQQDGTVVGTEFTAAGNGTLVLQLGGKPKGATGWADSVTCEGGGNYSALVDGKADGGGSCDGNGAEARPTTSTTKTLTFQTHGSAQRLTVWATWIALPKIEPSAAQQAEIATGTVSRASYLAGFNRYAGCLAAAGYPLGNVDESAPILNFTVPGGAVDSGADNRCYVSEWAQVDALWQLQNWSSSATANYLRGCLKEAGFTPAATESAMWDQVHASAAASKCMNLPPQN